MRPVAAFAILFPVLAVLAACSLVQRVVLFNNTGMPIAVQMGSSPFSIAAGESRDFRYPSELENWTLLISDGRCEYLYQVPKSLEHWSWPMDYKTEPTVQVERDFSIWAVPPGAASAADVSGLSAQQVNGFPLHPVSKICH